jgi:molybdate transport system substrate-binding protein
MNAHGLERRSRTAVAAFVVFALAITSACARPGAGRSGSGSSGELVVFAAASLTEAFNEIATGFAAANPGAKVTFNFAGSQQLLQQIAQGAPCDVFASANKTLMDAAVLGGRIELDSARTFVRNRLVVITPKDNPAKIASLADLAKHGLKLVLAAKGVPVGQYSLDMFDNVEKSGSGGDHFTDAVLANVVSYEQDVKAVLAKVTLGEADAGVVYASDISAAATDKVTKIEVPDAVNVIADYPIAALKDSPRLELAKKFVDYVRSPAGQTVLVKYGFIPTTGDATGAAPAAVPLEINGLVATPQKFTADDLAKLEQTKVDAGDKAGAASFTGVRIATLLDLAKVNPDAKTIALVGGDGYTKELAIADVTKDDRAIVAIADNGSLRSVIPSQGPGYGVKGLVRIDVR